MIPMYSKCGQCSGSGEYDVPGPEEGMASCSECGGLGYKEVYYIDISDLSDTVADILDKVNDIKQQLDEM